MARERQKFECALELRIFVRTPLLCPPVHQAHIVECTSTLKSDLTPNRTQVIVHTMESGSMIYQDYGSYVRYLESPGNIVTSLFKLISNIKLLII